MESNDEDNHNEHRNRRHQFDPDQFNVESFGVHRKLEPLAPASFSDDEFPIERLDLKVRTYNCLARGGIRFVSQLKLIRIADVRTLPHFTAENMDDLQRQLVAFGFQPLTP